jgi:small subunit ribosomal protein S16
VSVRVRLTRVGSRKNPIWRVVVADQRSPRDGRILETVGRYNPQRQPSEIVLDRERIEYWLSHGAQLSETVRSLLRGVDREAPPERAAARGDARPAQGAAAAVADGDGGEGSPDRDAGDAEPSEAEAGTDDTAAGSEAAAEEGAREGAPVADAAPADAEGEVDEEASERATAAGGG